MDTRSRANDKQYTIPYIALEWRRLGVVHGVGGWVPGQQGPLSWHDSYVSVVLLVSKWFCNDVLMLCLCLEGGVCRLRLCCLSFHFWVRLYCLVWQLHIFPSAWTGAQALSVMFGVLVVFWYCVSVCFDMFWPLSFHHGLLVSLGGTSWWYLRVSAAVWVVFAIALALECSLHRNQPFALISKRIARQAGDV